MDRVIFMFKEKVYARIVTDLQDHKLDIDQTNEYTMYELHRSMKDLKKYSEVFINPSNPKQLIATSKGRLLSIEILSEITWFDLDYYYGQ